VFSLETLRRILDYSHGDFSSDVAKALNATPGTDMPDRYGCLNQVCPDAGSDKIPDPDADFYSVPDADFSSFGDHSESSFQNAQAWEEMMCFLHQVPFYVLTGEEAMAMLNKFALILFMLLLRNSTHVRQNIKFIFFSHNDCLHYLNMCNSYRLLREFNFSHKIFINQLHSKKFHKISFIKPMS
jgi:hypothetical protein